MSSVWTDTTSATIFPTLKESVKTEVLIIGGGITGILCAHYLQQAKIPYLLAEASSICSGITKNTTAKITAQHGLIYHKLLHSLGREKAALYLESQNQALSEYQQLCKHIPCHFENKPNFIYATKNSMLLEKELVALEQLRFPALFSSSLPIPVSIAGAIGFPNQAQFHPLQFLTELAKPLHIYERTKIVGLDGTTAFTDHGTITAKAVIITTHFPFLNKHGSYFLKLYQHRSYVLALEQAAKYPGMYADESKEGLSFRNYGNQLLLGGGSHRTGKAGGAWEELRTFAKKNYPSAKETAYWATQDCMSLDEIPYIGQYSARTPRLFVATGFNKWGMTNAMVAAKLLRDLLTKGSSPYQSLYSPSRNILKPQLMVNMAESVSNLLSPTTKRCPHLGCALKWNPVEHSWDCPCHGSRFDASGTLIDNPATGNLKH